jgi:hypothetical protein
MDHRRHRLSGRDYVATLGRFFGGLLVFVAGAINAVWWWFVFVFHCDENCDDGFSGSWFGRSDGWQWSVLFGLGIACFVLCLAFAASLGTRRTGLSLALFAAAILTGVVAPWLLWLTG